TLITPTARYSALSLHDALPILALALPGEEDADVLAEFVRHPASALVRGGRVARVADDQNRVRAGRAHLGGVELAGDRPLVAPAGQVPAQEGAEDRRYLLELRQQLLHVRQGRALLVVQAGDGPLRVGGRAIPARRLPLVVAVGQGEQGGAVALLGGLQGEGERRPALLRVERQDDAGQGEGLGEHPAVRRRRQRLGVDAPQQVRYLARALLGVLAGGLQVVVQGALEAERLVLGVADGVGGRVDDRVEREAAHLVGEQVGVHAAEFGAVGDAQIVQLVVADGLADAVHVAGAVGGRDVGQQLAGGLLAALAEVDGVLQERALLGGGVRGAVHLRLGGLDVLVAAAADALAGGHSARVPADEVVALAELGGGAGVGRQHVHARAAGPAEVEQQRAEAVVPGGLRPYQGQPDRRAVRLRPVQRNFQRGALPAVPGGRFVAGGLAGSPVQCRRALAVVLGAAVTGAVTGAAPGAARGQQPGGDHQGRPPYETRHLPHPPSLAVRTVPRMAVRPS